MPPGTQVYYISVSGNTENPGATNTGAYTVSVAEKAVLAPGTGADIEGGPTADKLTGTADSESIAGLGGDDTLYGLGGDDILDGNGGNDLLVGGAGGDTLKGGAGTDTISYAGSASGVTINLLSGTATGGDAEGDTLGTMIENVIGSMYGDMLTGTDDPSNGNGLWGLGGDDMLYGRDGPDMLYGGGGDDSLDGGDDMLFGGAGDDDLGGGAGNDTFVFGPGNGADVILSADDGFSATEDKIDLRAFGLTAEELTALISLRAGNAVINLSYHGGGTITIQSVTDLDTFETGANTTDDKIDTLSVWADDATGDNATDGDGIVQATEPGLFIL